MKKVCSKIIIWLLVLSFFIEATPVWALTKEENIYTKLNSDGTINSTFVYEHLYGTSDKIFKDKSSLSNIENINGKEKYSLEDNELTWEANGNDIYYTGTANKDLPISMSIKYYLDDEEYQANDMLGKKGNVKIVIKYENHLKKQVIVNGKVETLYTPFVVATTSLLPNENNKNIKVTNGKVINNGETSIVVGLSSPGLYESLNIDELKGFDTIEITYETNSFELSSMYAVATSKVIDDNDLNVFNRIKDLYTAIDKLQENMDLLVDGSKKLANGTNEFNNAIKDIKDKYYYYRNIDENEIINTLIPFLNDAIDSSLPALKNKINEVIKQGLNNIEPEMIEAIASATINSTKEVIEGEINRILSEVDLEKFVKDVIGEELIESLKNDQEIAALTNNLIQAIGGLYNNEIDIITKDALKDLINQIDVNMSYSDRQAYIENIADTYGVSYDTAEAIANKVEQDTISNIKNNLNSNSSNISLNIASKVLSNITSSEHLNVIVNEYVANANDIITEVMNDESVKQYQEQLKNNIAKYIKDELAKKDLIERYVESSKYLESIINEIIDKTANELSDTYFTYMTSDTIKQLINEKLNKYSIKNELENLLNNVDSKMSIIDEKIDLLASSVELINGGANQLANGLEMYNDQGIKKISGLVNGSVKSITGKIEALTKLSNDYKTLDDINDKDNGKSKIIFMVDSLKKVEDKKITTEKIVEKETIWDKIKGLFK